MAVDSSNRVLRPPLAINPIDANGLDYDRVVFSYDRDSDTLIVHLYGRGRAAVSIEAGDNAYVRWDRAAGEVVGLHLENVRRAVVPMHPGLLDHAAEFGINSVASGNDGGSAEPDPITRKRDALLALDALFDQPTVVGRPR